MNFDKLRYFVHVAQTLSFTKAAEECHIAQTAMSRQIASLEEEIGVVLLYRNNRSVKLTEAGKFFYQEAVELLHKYEDAVHRTKLAEHGQIDKLSIGIGLQERSIAAEFSEQFHQRHPYVIVSAFQHKYSDLVTAFNQSKIDVIFAHPRALVDISQESVVAYKLFHTQLGMILNSNHPLASMDSVKPSMIEQECIITTSEEFGPLTIEHFRAVCAADGWFPTNVRQANSLEAQILMVEMGLGIAPFPASLKNMLSDKTVFIPYETHLSKEYYWVLMKKDNQNPIAAVFMEDIAQNIQSRG